MKKSKETELGPLGIVKKTQMSFYNEDNSYGRKIKKQRLTRVVTEILKALSLNCVGVDIHFVSDATIKKLNRQFRKINKVTDVLSFPHVTVTKKKRYDMKSYDHLFLGDIVLCVEQAERQAKEQNVSLHREVSFLILHSLLHLLGHDHGRPKETALMQTFESQIFKKLIAKKWT